MPSLPVDSARSCSSQAPRSAIAGDATSVSLSRPRRAHTPMIDPSTRPGLSAAGTEWEQLCAMRSARSSSACTSRPITAPGSMPKSDRAEYRPPIDARPCATWRKPFSSASCSSFEPGSVIAMKRRGASSAPTASRMRSKKYCSKMFGSSVVPDLLETMQTVRVRSSSCSRALTCAGSVESRMRSSGMALAAREREREQLRTEARATHAEQQRVVEARPGDVPRDAVEPLGVRELVLGHVEPAEPLRLVGARPQRADRRPTGASPCPLSASPRSCREPRSRSRAGGPRAGTAHGRRVASARRRSPRTASGRPG